MSIAERFKERRLGAATSQEAKGFLVNLAQPVIDKKKERQVLAANLLELGKAGPLMPDQTLVGVVKTAEGWRVVPDEIWGKALGLYATDIGCTLESVGFETRTKRGQKGQPRNEIVLETNIKRHMLRICG